MQYKHTSLPKRKRRGSLEYIFHYVVVWQGGVILARTSEDDTAARFVCDEAYQGLAVIVTAVRGAWAAEEVLVSMHT